MGIFTDTCICKTSTSQRLTASHHSACQSLPVTFLAAVQSSALWRSMSTTTTPFTDMCAALAAASLPSARLLDIHIQEWHDSLFTILAQRQDLYQCLVEGCGQKFRTSKHRKDHLIRFTSILQTSDLTKQKGQRNPTDEETAAERYSHGVSGRCM
ncbi:hypothetical protein EPR50_G00177880 [Perca flavescens]|uniref:C2H2-type domain-containing protein n=1 Tax=Perca flavescens TaxID=8167 RepID=A0A484CC29_PERFV|nr:hypothetical protein EPR50_G00177880 [Perca flavescens]